jgi:beta-alanine--pyruvate transaminase
MQRSFQEEDLLVRVTGDTIALAPPLIISEQQIAEVFESWTGRSKR